MLKSTGEGAWQRFLFGSSLQSSAEEFQNAGAWLRDRVLADSGLHGQA